MKRLFIYGLLVGAIFSLPKAMQAQSLRHMLAQQGVFGTSGGHPRDGKFHATVVNVFVTQFGDIPISHHVDLLSILFWVFPQLVALHVLGDRLSRTLHVQAPYVVTRQGRNPRWFIGHVRGLLLSVVLYTVTICLASALVSTCAGLPWQQGVSANVPLLWTITLLALSTMLVVLTVTILSLYMPVLIGTIVVLACEMLCLTASAVAGANARATGCPGILRLLEWFPFGQGVYGWHGTNGSTSVIHMSTAVSATYLFLCCAVLIGGGLYRMKTMDFL